MTDTSTAPPSPLRRALGPLLQFNRAFWVTNTLELLERGAWYSLVGVLAAYLRIEMQAPATLVGIVFLLFYPLAYFTPLLSSALGEKFGYKRMLLVAFGFLTAGYLIVALAGTPAMVVAGIVVAGLGAGTFKPLAATLVADTTTVEQRNFAYAIYYGGVNLGAFVFPLVVGLIGLAFPDYLYTAAFAIATVLVAVNLVVVLALFRNVREPQPGLNVGGALKGLGAIASQPAFLALCAIYSGFWFLYSTKEGYLPIYMLEFERMPEWFNAGFLATVSPLVIILVAPLPILGRLVNRVESLFLIIIGVALYVSGFVLLGFSSDPMSFLAGIVIFSVGEVIAQPAFMSYVSKIAPPDKVAIYQSYGFLPLGVGLAIGSFFGGTVYDAIARGMGRPALFWAVMSAMGFLTISALLLYNWQVQRRRAAAAPSDAPRRRGVGVLAGAGAALAVLLLIPALLAGSTLVDRGAPAASAALPGDGALVALALPDVTGTVQEGANATVSVLLPANATGLATFTLLWTDEAAGAGETNAPDTLRLIVVLPNGTRIASGGTANGAGGDGSITLEAPAVPSAYTVIVEAVDCGDSAVQIGPLAVPQTGSADTGNAWTVEVTHQAPGA